MVDWEEVGMDLQDTHDVVGLNQSNVATSYVW